MTVGEMTRKMTSAELSEWMAFYQIEPFGEQRRDIRMGVLANAMLQPYLKKGRRPPTLDKYIMFAENDRPKQSPEEQQLIAQMWTQRFNDGNAKNTGT